MTWAMSALKLKVCQQASVRQNFLRVQRENLQAQLLQAPEQLYVLPQSMQRSQSSASVCAGSSCVHRGGCAVTSHSTLTEGALCIHDCPRQPGKQILMQSQACRT